MDVKKSLIVVGEKIREKEKEIIEKRVTINKFLRYSVFQDMEQTCYDTQYKYYDLKLCLFKNIDYKGFNAGRHKTKLIG
jgi:hypothetical protein